jgi:curli biogenesis system outer membrane secretion channel CsgG
LTRTKSGRVRLGVVKPNRIKPWATCLVIALSLSAGAWTVAASPDLVASELIVDPPAPLPGENVLLTAIVENRGDTDVPSRFFVRFEVDGESLGTIAVESLTAGGRESVSSSWVAEEGTHTIRVEVDQPYDRIEEADESNNTARADVSVSTDVLNRLAGVRIAVGPFEDNSSSGYVNVGGGVADKLAGRLEELGLRTIDRSELEGTMQEAGLNPYLLADAAAAAAGAGADLFLTGSVGSISVARSTVILGAISLTGGTAEVSISAELVDVTTAEPVARLAAEGRYEGSSEVKIDLGALFSIPESRDVCGGGLKTDRDAYYEGEPIAIGYLNPGEASWFGVEIYSSTGTFLRWLGWRYIAEGACTEWFWNQIDSFGEQVDPSIYVAKLRGGTAPPTSTTIQVRPGLGRLPELDEVTVGTESFEESIVGGALNRAVDRLVSSLVGSLEAVLLSEVAHEEGFAASAGEIPAAASLGGQVAATLPDGRIAINIGLTSGVSKGDFFLVVSQDDDSILGEIVVVEVRDQVSYAVKTSEFEVQVGDAVRFAEP